MTTTSTEATPNGRRTQLAQWGALLPAGLLVTLAWSNPWHGVVGEAPRVVLCGALGIAAILSCMLGRPGPTVSYSVGATCLLVSALAAGDLARDPALGAAFVGSPYGPLAWSLTGAVGLAFSLTYLWAQRPSGFPRPARRGFRTWAWLLGVLVSLFVADLGRARVDAYRVTVTMAKIRDTARSLAPPDAHVSDVPFIKLSRADQEQLASALPPRLSEGVRLPGMPSTSRGGRIEVLDAWGRGLCVGTHEDGAIVISGGADGRSGPPTADDAMGPIVEQSEQDLVFDTYSFVTYPGGHVYRFDRRRHRWLVFGNPDDCAALFERERHRFEDYVR